MIKLLVTFIIAYAVVGLTPNFLLALLITMCLKTYI